MSVMQLSELHVATVAKYWGDADVVGSDNGDTYGAIKSRYVAMMLSNQMALEKRYGDKPQSKEFISAGFDEAYDKAKKPTPVQYAKLCDSVQYNIIPDGVLDGLLRVRSKQALIKALGANYDDADWSI